jgi:hypothetical protein
MNATRMSTARWLLLGNLVVSWYNVAVIWLMQVMIYPSWALARTADFGDLQGFHFWRLFSVVFPQAGLSVLGAVAMLRWRPPRVSVRAVWLGISLQVAAWALTAAFWGRWQARIALPVPDRSLPAIGPANRDLYHTLLTTHWVRVALLTAYGALLFWMAASSFLSEQHWGEGIIHDARSHTRADRRQPIAR